MRKRPSPMHGSRQIHPLGEDPALQSLTPRSLARNVAELEALRERVQELEQTLSRHEIAAVDVVSTAPARKLPPLVPDSIGTSEDGTVRWHGAMRFSTEVNTLTRAVFVLTDTWQHRNSAASHGRQIPRRVASAGAYHKCRSNTDRSRALTPSRWPTNHIPSACLPTSCDHRRFFLLEL